MTTFAAFSGPYFDSAFAIGSKGVEILHQLKTLYAYGCDLVQGGFFSAPLNAYDDIHRQSKPIQSDFYKVNRPSAQQPGLKIWLRVYSTCHDRDNKLPVMNSRNDDNEQQ